MVYCVAMNSPRFERAYPPAAPAETRPIIRVAFDGDGVLTEEVDGATRLPRVPVPPDGALFLGTLDGLPVVADDISEPAVPTSDDFSPSRPLPLRSLYGILDEDEYALAGYAKQLLHWRRISRFCPVCAASTEARAGDWGRVCPICSHVGYPPVSPAVLILVTDGPDRILLGHKEGWGTRFSILAGFVEPGESLEECVARETKEEVGLDVDTIEYAGSQPWPYPHQVMIGFTARLVGGEMRLQPEELDDARWFTRATLPELPGPLSLSRRMIDAWIDGTL